MEDAAIVLIDVYGSIRVFLTPYSELYFSCDVYGKMLTKKHLFVPYYSRNNLLISGIN